MPKTINERMHAKIDGDFVVFVIGIRINKPWKLHRWLPIIPTMPKMIKELTANPESGFLGSIGAFPFSVQYWRSFDHLTAFARNRNASHFPVWAKFNKQVGTSGDVGIWHETYLVRAGEYESIYNSMPPYGLGRFAELVPARGRYGSARSRAGKITNDDAPISENGEIRVMESVAA